MREMAANVKRERSAVPGSRVSVPGSGAFPLRVRSLEYGAMLLASDIGGTKTLLGLFSPERGSAARDRSRRVRHARLRRARADGARVPRRVEGRRAHHHGGVHRRRRRRHGSGGAADERALARGRAKRWPPALGLKRVEVINDLEALAYAVPVLEPNELAVLQQGIAVPGGNAAVIAAGTGHGHRDAAQRRRPVRAVRVRGRPRRLRGAHAARARARAPSSRACSAGSASSSSSRDRGWSTSISSRIRRSAPGR